MSIVQNVEIKASVNKPYVSFSNYKQFTFSSLLQGYYNTGNECSFIQRNAICFEDYVSCKYLTGNELFYYPELAKKMRELKEYPTIKRSYTIDRNFTGIVFLEYFTKSVLEAFEQYQAELIEIAITANHLIYLYGNDRHMPIIERMDFEELDAHRKRKKLVINGVSWYCENINYSKFKITENIDLYKLLNIPYADFKYVELEDAVLGTPFIALRFKKNHNYRGHINWYNLNTCEKVTKADITNWKKPA